MNCHECSAKIDDWLTEAWENEQELSPLPQDIQKHVHTCSICAAHLQATRQLVGATEYTDGSHYVQQYPDLTEKVANRVMDRILNLPDTKVVHTKAPIRFDWKRKYSYMFAAIAFASMVFISTELLLENPQPKPHMQPTVVAYTTIRLEVEVPEAQEVVVVGDWNQWNPAAQRLARVNGSDIWVIEINLTPGKEYRYQFVIDGEQWIPDPQSPLQLDDGFGGMNSVLET